MRRILAKRKSDPKGASIMVYRQRDGYPCIVDDGSDELIKPEELLLPDMNESGRHNYETAALQGLLANPNIIKNVHDLDEEETLYEILTAVDKISAVVYYDGCEFK